jgi:hypothetical protein
MAIEMHDLADAVGIARTSYGAIAFCVAAPALWNPSPAALHVTQGGVGYVDVARRAG